MIMYQKHQSIDFSLVNEDVMCWI